MDRQISPQRVTPESTVALIPTARIARDRVTERQVLLYPEGLLWLNSSGAEVLSLCDGPTRVSSLVATLVGKYASEAGSSIESDIVEFLDELLAKVVIRVVE